MGELQKLTESAEELAKSGDQDTSQAREKIIRVREEWTFVETLVEQRIKLALKYVAFHKKAQQVCFQIPIAGFTVSCTPCRLAHQ